MSIKKKVLTALCVGAFSLGTAAPVLEVMPEAAQTKAEAARSYICTKCQRTTTTTVGSPSPGNCPKGGTHSWIYRGEFGNSNNSSTSNSYAVKPHSGSTATSSSWWDLQPNPENIIRVKGNTKGKNAEIIIKNKSKYDVRLRLDIGFFKPTGSFKVKDGTLKAGQRVTFSVRPGNGAKDITLNKIGNNIALVDITINGEKGGGFKLQKVK